MTSPNIVVRCPRCTHPEILGITLSSSRKSSAGKKHLSSLNPFSEILLHGSRHPPLLAVQCTLRLLHFFSQLYVKSSTSYNLLFIVFNVCLPLVCVRLPGSRDVLLTSSGSTTRVKMLQQFTTRTYSPCMFFPRRCIPWTLLILSKASTALTRLR